MLQKGGNCSARLDGCAKSGQTLAGESGHEGWRAIDVTAQERFLTAAPPVPQAGLLLRYASGSRPDADRIAEALAQSPRAFVSHRPVAGPGGDAPGWLELLYDGLTFDCLGLDPAPALATADSRHRLGLVAGGAASEPESIGLFAGPHCAAAAASLPVVRAQLALACALVAHGPAPSELVWTPAALAVAPQVFVSAAQSWLGGGPFPALALIGYARQCGEGLTSDGLAFFTGQEVRIPEALIADPVAATQLAARLVHELVAAAPVQDRESFTGPDGDPLVLVPQSEGWLLSVERP